MRHLLAHQACSIHEHDNAIYLQVGYLSSWSPYSTWRHRHPEREDPLIAFKAEILEACNAADGSFGLVIEFPIFLFMAKRK